MKLTKCPNKHFYDADKYAECPHCHEAAPVAVGPGPAQRSVSQARPEGGSSQKPSTGGRSRRKHTMTENRTGSIWDQPEVAAEVPPEQPQYVEPVATEPQPEPKPVIVADEPEGEPPAEAPQPMPLQAAVEAVAPKHSAAEDMKTVAFYDLGGGEEPVVGWLVCVKGAYFGQSFNLKTGRNFIGRAGNNDVVLAQEGTVSRNRHAVITYEPGERKFFIQPGESNGLTYLGKQLVMQFEPMQAYSRIRLGNAEFVFVPCCGEQFCWEEFVS